MTDMRLAEALRMAAEHYDEKKMCVIDAPQVWLRAEADRIECEDADRKRDARIGAAASSRFVDNPRLAAIALPDLGKAAREAVEAEIPRSCDCPEADEKLVKFAHSRDYWKQSYEQELKKSVYLGDENKAWQARAEKAEVDRDRLRNIIREALKVTYEHTELRYLTRILEQAEAQ